MCSHVADARVCMLSSCGCVHICTFAQWPEGRFPEARACGLSRGRPHFERACVAPPTPVERAHHTVHVSSTLAQR